MSLSSRSLPTAVSLGLGLALAGLASAPARAAEPAPAGARTTQVLFMGADLSLEKDRAFHPVVDVTGKSLVIKPGGKTVEMPLSLTTSLRISEALKLASTGVAIDQLKYERAYSVGADPFDQVAKAATQAAGQDAVVDIANRDVVQANMMVGVATSAVAMASPETRGQLQASLDNSLAIQAAAEEKMDRAIETPIGQVYDVGTQANKAGLEEPFNSIRLSFDVTAEKHLEQPYYSVIALIRDRDSKPGQVRKWAYVQSLGPLNAGVSRHVLVYQSGFPPGYILESCEVHIYNGPEELSTNLSRKRVPLTDDEAREYRVVEYIGNNKGRTLPATPAGHTFAGAARSALTKAQLDETWYVRVTKTGDTAGVFRDAGGQRPVQDPPLEAAFKTLYFKPALKDGKPVESIVPLNLGQFETSVNPEK